MPFVGLLIVGGLWLGLLGIFAYYILFFDRLEVKERAGCGCALGVCIALPVAFQIFVFFRDLPRVAAIKKFGLGLADIHQAAHLSDTKARFMDPPQEEPFNQYLKKLEESINQPDAAIWQELRAKLRDRLGGPQRFGHDVWQAFLEWGKSLVPSPEPVSDEKAILAALKRLTGKDDLPEHIRQCAAKFGNVQVSSAISVQVRAAPIVSDAIDNLFYPNEDAAFLRFGSSVGGKGGALLDVGPNPKNSPAEEIQGAVFRVLWAFSICLVLGFAIQRCFRWFALSLPGRLLRLGGNKAFREFEREVYSPRIYLITLIVFVALSLPLNLLTLDPYLVLIHPTYWAFSAACLWNVMLAGILVEGLEQLMGVVFLRFGIDPLRTVWDNVLAGALAVGLLLYFENSWTSILLGLGMGMAQSLIAKFALPPAH
jgi:hypothetical protein